MRTHLTVPFVLSLSIIFAGSTAHGSTTHRKSKNAANVTTKHLHRYSAPVSFLKRQQEIDAKESAASTKPGVTPQHQPQYSKAQIIAWHLSAAQDAWNRRDHDTAYANWREVLRIDNGNPQAMAALKESMVDQSKHALKMFSQARGLTALAEALDDATDDSIAQRLLIVYRNQIQRVDGSTHHSPDMALYDDFENYIDNNGLGYLVSKAELGQEVPFYPGRIYGRRFLVSLAPWVQRVEASGIYVRVIYPFNSENSAEHMENDRFTLTNTGEVYIDGPNVGPAIPIEAIWQNGDYRISPRPGFKLLYQFETHVAVRKYKRI